MKINVPALLCYRYLFPGKGGAGREGFITIVGLFSFLGILLGVGTLIVVLAVMNGFRQELFSKILGFNGEIVITAPAHTSDRIIFSYPDWVKQFSAVSGVAQVLPLVEGQAMILHQGKAQGVVVKGASFKELSQRPLLGATVQAGSWVWPEPNGVALGLPLAKKLGVNPGDTLRLVAPTMTQSAFGALPRYKDFTVAVIFESGNYTYDAGIVFIPLESGQKFFKIKEGGVHELEVLLKNSDDLDRVLPTLLSLAKGKVEVQDWRQKYKGFYEALTAQRNVMFLVVTLIIVIAAFNIITGLVMLVRDKTHDIGILRTIGLSRGQTLKIFLLCGSFLGGAGTLIGTLLGVLFATHIDEIRVWVESLVGAEIFSAEFYFLTHIPAAVEVQEVGLVATMSLTLSLLAALYPAWRAASLDPVQALRAE